MSCSGGLSYTTGKISIFFRHARNALDTVLPSRYTTQMHMAQLHFSHPTGENPGIPYPSYATGRKSVSYNQ